MSYKSKGKAQTRKLVVLNEEELIRQVALRPILYDRTLKAYRKSGLRQQYWKEVGQTMGASLEECRRRWRSLRDAFSKHFKQTTKLGEEQAAKRKKWVFYEQMSFIAPYLDNASYEIAEHLLEEYGDNSDDDADILQSASSERADNDETNKLTTNKRITKNKSSTLVEDSSDEEEEQEKEEEKLSESDSKLNLNAALRLHSTDFLPQRESPAVVVPESTATLTEQQAISDEITAMAALMTATPTTTICSSTTAVTTSETNAYPPLDSDEKFLISCVPTLRRLSNRNNSLARLKIQQILFDIEFGSES